jgi:hypothetical protein
MVKHKHLKLFLLLLFLLSSCGYIPQPDVKPLQRTSTVTPSHTLAFSETPDDRFSTTTISKTIKLTTATPTLSPTSTYKPTSTLPVQVTTKCLRISMNKPENAKVHGRIVLQEDPKYSYMLDMETGEKIQLHQNKNEQLDQLNVSKDGKLLVLQKIKTNTSPRVSSLVIAGDDGRERITLPWDKTWRLLSGWLDSKHVVIDQKGDIHDTLIVLNPFTGQQQKFFGGNYPDLYDLPDIGWDVTTNLPLAIDSTISRLLYSSAKKEGKGFTLWNLRTNKEQVFFQVDGVQREPQWSQDGNQVIVNKPVLSSKRHSSYPDSQELFSISRDGVVNRLTYLSDYYEKNDISNFSLSPDGHYIAFGLAATPLDIPDYYPKDSTEPIARLAILDIFAQKVINYCIPYYWGFYKPIWSPDSHQVLLWNVSDAGKEQVILVDIDSEYSTQIAEGAEPLGWMVSPGE